MNIEDQLAKRIEAVNGRCDDLQRQIDAQDKHISILVENINLLRGDAQRNAVVQDTVPWPADVKRGPASKRKPSADYTPSMEGPAVVKGEY